MNNIIDIDSYIPLKNDKFLFDANIWLYLYCQLGNYNKDTIKKYGIFLKKVIQLESSVFISALLLSEIFNTWIKLEFNILKNQYPSKYNDFKRDFRNTQNYKNLVSTIKTEVTSKILKIANRIDDKFSNISLDKLFYKIENSDFNDNYFLATANLESFKIVTNDSDFAFSRKIPVLILTANNKLLRRN